MKRILRSFLVIIISNSLMFLPLVNVNAAEDLALPSGDVIAPEIKHTPSTTIIPVGEFINIHATVTDNVGVRDVIVFYREKINTNEFKRTKMTQELGTSFYSVSIPGAVAPGIEYYIQATDQAGNTILHGHTFSPLTVSVSTDAPPLGAEDKKITMLEDDTADKPKKGISKWVWIGLGVLAVGALGGSDDPSPGPTTGTLTIGGTIPAP